MSGHSEAVHGGFWGRTIQAINGPWHKVSMWIYVVIVVAHWAEHLLQAFQIYVLHWPHAKALGALGMLYPWLVHSEWLHYVYALVMLVGLFLLRPGFVGRGRGLWNIALGIQFWHHIEHAILLTQALTGHPWFGMPAPTSLVQLLIPRVELHLFYNALVTIPMLFSSYYHVCPPAGAEHMATCSCTLHRRQMAANNLPTLEQT